MPVQSRSYYLGTDDTDAGHCKSEYKANRSLPVLRLYISADDCLGYSKGAYKDQHGQQERYADFSYDTRTLFAP